MSIRKDLWSCLRVRDVWYVNCRSDDYGITACSCICEQPTIVNIRLAVQKTMAELVDMKKHLDSYKVILTEGLR